MPQSLLEAPAGRMATVWAAVCCLAFAGAAAADESEYVVGEGREVALQYTLSLAANGEVLESNVDGEPLVYMHGQGQLLPALEARLEGLSAGDERQVELEADEAYGEHNPELMQEVSPDMVPEEGREVGQVLVGSDGDGQPFEVRVAEVDEDRVLLDFNHPLAGEALRFDVTVLSVR